MLKDVAEKHYFANNYNCAEAIIRAGNEYYGLGITDKDMVLVSGFGAGMQSGNTCGTILSAISILSMKYVETKAHDSKDIRPATQMLLRKFKEVYNGTTLCKEIKPQFFSKELRCWNTVAMACDVIESVLNEYTPAQPEA